MPRLLDEVRDLIRVRHYSIRTEEAYERWIKFIFFHSKRHPAEMGEREVSDFLSHLAELFDRTRHLSASSSIRSYACQRRESRSVASSPLAPNVYISAAP